MTTDVPDIRELIARAVSLGAVRIELTPQDDQAVVVFQSDEPIETEQWPWPTARRFVDDLKGQADMPVGRDKPHAGHIVINEDAYYGTLLVLTDPHDGGREHLEVRLRLEHV